MEYVFTDVAIILGCIAGALVFLYILQLTWAPSARRLHNDMVGPNVGVIGTTYAVIVAFMLSGVWSNFRQAEGNAEQESNALVGLFRLAKSLPPESAQRIRNLARESARLTIDKEWKAMEAGKTDLGEYHVVQQLWDTLTEVLPRNPSEQVALDASIDQLSKMTEYRRIRELQSRSQLPPILWAVLVVGAMVTVGSTCLFGVEDFKLHMVQVFALTFLISLVLVAIRDIDRPFQGSVHVEPDAFRFAQQTFEQELPKQAP